MQDLAETTNKGGDGSTLATVLEKKGEVIPFEVLEEEKLPGSRVRFKLKLTEEALAGRLDETIKEFSRQVRIPGFRPGKAPKNLVRKSYEAAAREETIKRMVPRLVELYAAEKKIETLSQPYLLDFTSAADRGTTVELALEVHPDIPISDELLAGLSVEVRKIRVDDDYVQRAVEDLRAQNATYEPTEDAYGARDGLLFNCVVNGPGGVRIDDRCADMYYSTKIEQEMPEAVAAALVGKKKGDRLSIDIEEDVEFGEAGEKQTIHYEVELLEVKKRVLPELDDEFAKDVSEQHESLGDLRKAVREGAAKQEEARQREEGINAIFEILRQRLEFDLPRALVESTANKSINDMEKRLNEYGMSLRSMDEKIVRSYAASMQEQAKVNVKNYLLMRALSKYLAVTPTEEQINEALETIAKQTGRKPLAIRAQLEAKRQWAQFVEDLTLKLTNDVILGRATVSYKEVSAAEFEAMEKERQESQAAKLRGEAPAPA